jgi:hypothetical protein
MELLIILLLQDHLLLLKLLLGQVDQEYFSLKQLQQVLEL